jgi:hypothetical protein
VPEFPDINTALCRKKLTPKHTPESRRYAASDAAMHVLSLSTCLMGVPHGLATVRLTASCGVPNDALAMLW